MDHKTKVLPKYPNRVNTALAKKMGLSAEEISAISDLQQQRRDYYKRMEIAPVVDLPTWDSKCTELEFQLQKAWGFQQDSKYHKFWERPRCTCPKMDNDDGYPYGYYTISGVCPLHGSGRTGV
jgi:hypothetical protein